ncbi:hypothetical protein [Dysosmobacter sp. Phy]
MKNSCRDCNDRPTQLEKLNELIEKAKSYSVVLITGVIIIGILMVFWCSIAHKEIPGLSEMNQFVSIVLGVVATIVSIVSMLFSFYGLEKTEESERRQSEVLQRILSIEEDTRRSAKAIESSMQTRLKDANVISRDKENTGEDENIQVDTDDI